MTFGRMVGASFLGSLSANVVNDLITGGFHRQQQFEYPYAYQPTAYNPGFNPNLNPGLYYNGNNGFDYTRNYLPTNQFINPQAQWGQPRYPWGDPQTGYDGRQGRGMDQNPLGLSEFDEGSFAADQTLAKRNLCSAVQAIHDMEVMDAMTRRHFPGFQSHYARDMFNVEKQRLRTQGYDLRYHQCADGSGDREFGIFDLRGQLVDKMRVRKLMQQEVPDDQISPVVS